MLTQLTPFWLRGLRCFSAWLSLMWLSNDWYSVAAITIAFSGVWQMNAWHSNCLDCWFDCFDLITTVKIGACEPDDRRRRSDGLKMAYVFIRISSFMNWTSFSFIDSLRKRKTQTLMEWITIFCPNFLDQWLTARTLLCHHSDSIQILPLTIRRY